MKIRIFALAKELDMDSKLLIDYCSKAGITIKNSALASISPEERDRVLEFIKSDSGESAAAQPQTPVPTRDDAKRLSGRVRPIKTMVARPQTGRSKTAAPPPPDTTDTETVTEEQPANPAAEAEPEPAETPDGAATTTAEAPPDEEQGPGDAQAPLAEPEKPKSPSQPTPVTRDDYVPASGAARPIRPMEPRGTSDTSRPKKSKPQKKQPSISLSHLAKPTYKAPEAKPEQEEVRAQKPDMRLPADVLQKGSPLADHMHRAEKKRTKRGHTEDLLGEHKDQKRGGSGERTAGLGLAESRERRRESRRLAQQMREEDREGRVVARRRRQARTVPASQLKTSAQIETPITVRSLSEALGRPAKSLMKILFDLGEMVTINAALDEETALSVAMELGVDLQIRRARDLEDEVLTAIEAEDSAEDAELRPPIITILGHVDHGKTTLVDRLRSSNVVAGEAGGITQHIAAYQIDRDGQKLTFVDTPGHAAFGEMRARGANVTDIVVLVVAADDGVMPQTAECIAHARAAGVPLVVAMNKIDLPDTNEQKVLQELSAHEVLPAEWGGDVEVVRTSGLTGQGLDELLDTLLVTAELHEFKANPNRPAVGTCLEAFRSEGRGVVAWIIVQRGTLRVGDILVCGGAYGRIRAMYNERDEEIDEAPPSTPIKIAGLDEVPGAGDRFCVLDDLEAAREIAERRQQRGRAETLAHSSGKPRTLDDILNAARDGEVQDLPLIVKADTPGSLEALASEIDKFDHPEVRVKILHEAVGGVNESDVALAGASGAVIIAFHVIAEDRAQQIAQQQGVDIQRYNIIYEVTEHIRRSLEGLLRPERVEVTTGRALVLQTFNISRYGTIAGCRVLNGNIDRNSRIHVIRDQTILNDYNIASLRREKDDVREVREGMECGIRLDGFNDVKQGDLLEAFRIDEIKRTLN